MENMMVFLKKVLLAVVGVVTVCVVYMLLTFFNYTMPMIFNGDTKEVRTTLKEEPRFVSAFISNIGIPLGDKELVNVYGSDNQLLSAVSSYGAERLTDQLSSGNGNVMINTDGTAIKKSPASQLLIKGLDVSGFPNKTDGSADVRGDLEGSGYIKDKDIAYYVVMGQTNVLKIYDFKQDKYYDIKFETDNFAYEVYYDLQRDSIVLFLQDYGIEFKYDNQLNEFKLSDTKVDSMYKDGNYSMTGYTNISSVKYAYSINNITGDIAKIEQATGKQVARLKGVPIEESGKNPIVDMKPYYDSYDNTINYVDANNDFIKLNCDDGSYVKLRTDIADFYYKFSNDREKLREVSCTIDNGDVYCASNKNNKFTIYKVNQDSLEYIKVLEQALSPFHYYNTKINGLKKL